MANLYLLHIQFSNDANAPARPIEESKRYQPDVVGKTFVSSGDPKKKVEVDFRNGVQLNFG